MEVRVLVNVALVVLRVAECVRVVTMDVVQTVDQMYVLELARPHVLIHALEIVALHAVRLVLETA